MSVNTNIPNEKDVIFFKDLLIKEKKGGEKEKERDTERQTEQKHHTGIAVPAVKFSI